MSSEPVPKGGACLAKPADSPVTAYDRLATRIREQILSGELSPGDRLPAESALSAHYQVSRNTVREALRSLASQGLIAIKRGVTGGAFVATLSPAQVSDALQMSLTVLADREHVSVPQLLEVREILEVPAAELAALRRTDDDLISIHETLFDQTSMPPAQVFAASQEFHARLVRAAHNPLLALVAGPVFRVLEERFLRDRAPGRFWGDVDHGHREILGYLDAHDQAGAREAARAHLRSLRGTYERMDRERSD
jgi:GntR family transcriptional regulator, transcriptional repressor for pyruvate dehydrogenase complex